MKDFGGGMSLGWTGPAKEISALMQRSRDKHVAGGGCGGGGGGVGGGVVAG